MMSVNYMALVPLIQLAKVHLSTVVNTVNIEKVKP